MPSSEKVISPGVFTNEVDESFLPAAVGEIGAALIGPTVKGPPLIPTVVSSMSEFEQIFGGAQKSGSDSFSYLTSLTARSYLQNQNKLTVVRILDGNFTQAFANVHTGYSGSGYTGSRDMSVTGDSTGGGSANDKGYLDTEKHSAASTVELPISFRLNTQGYG